MVKVPLTRVTTLKDINPESLTETQYVIYWMIAFKRVGYNFALQRAVEWANQLSQPLLKNYTREALIKVKLDF